MNQIRKFVLFLLSLIILLVLNEALIADEKKIISCGEYSVEKVYRGPVYASQRPGSFIKVIDAKGNLIKEIGEKKEIGEWYIDDITCEDITGDNIPELIIVEANVVGMHPYFRYYVYSLGKKVKNLLIFEGGHGGGLKEGIKDLNGDGIKEIIAGDDSFVYWNLPYSASPRLTFVLCYREGKYVDCTEKFPELLEKDIEEAEREIKSGSDDDEIKGAALKIIATSILMGKETMGWKRLKQLKRETEEDLIESAIEWLREHRKEIKDQLSKRSSKIKYDSD